MLVSSYEQEQMMTAINGSGMYAALVIQCQSLPKKFIGYLWTLALLSAYLFGSWSNDGQHWGGVWGVGWHIRCVRCTFRTLVLNTQHRAGWCGGKAPDLHRKGARFECRPGHWLPWLRLPWLSSVANAGMAPPLNHDRFLPKPFPFIRHQSSYLCLDASSVVG
jgi:hypothetical protein